MGDVGVAALALLPGVRGLGDVVGPLQQRQVGLGVALPVQRGQRLEHRADDGAALAGDDAAGQPVADPAARGAVGVARLGADVVGTADDGAVGQRRPATARSAGSASAAAAAVPDGGLAGPRGSRVGGYVGGHGDSCWVRGGRPSPC